MENKLKLSCLFVLVLMATIVMSQTGNESEKNINRLLNNQVIVSRQIMCVLEKSPCDQLGRQLKGESESYFLVAIFCHRTLPSFQGTIFLYTFVDDIVFCLHSTSEFLSLRSTGQKNDKKEFPK